MDKEVEEAKMELLDSKEILDNQVPQELLERLALKELKVLVVSLVCLEMEVRQVKMDHQEHRVREEHLERLEILVQWALRELLVSEMHSFKYHHWS